VAAPLKKKEEKGPENLGGKKIAQTAPATTYKKKPSKNMVEGGHQFFDGMGRKK